MLYLFYQTTSRPAVYPVRLISACNWPITAKSLHIHRIKGHVLLTATYKKKEYKININNVTIIVTGRATSSIEPHQCPP